MKNYISYEKKQHELARQRGHALFSVQVNGKPCKQESITIQGPLDFETAKRLTLFCFWTIEAEMTAEAAFRKVFQDSKRAKASDADD